MSTVYTGVRLTEEEISDYLTANKVEDNKTYSDAFNWLLLLESSEVSVEDVLYALIKGGVSIEELVKASQLSTEAERINCLKTIISTSTKVSVADLYNAFKVQFKAYSTVLYEKFFKYAERKYKDPKIFLVNKNVNYLSDNAENLSDTGKYSAYQSLLSLYAQFYYTHPLASAESTLKADSESFLFKLNGSNLETDMNLVGAYSWISSGDGMISSGFPLLKDPLVTSIDADVFSNDVLIGFMLRSLYEPNFCYDADELKIAVLTASAYALKQDTSVEGKSGSETEADYYLRIFKAYASYMVQYFSVSNSCVTNFISSANGLDSSTSEKKAAFDRLFPSTLCNREFIHRLFYYNFDNFGAVVCLECIFYPVMRDFLMANGFEDAAAKYAGLIPAINSSTVALMDSMSLVAKELVAYSDFIVGRYNDIVDGTYTAEE